MFTLLEDQVGRHDFLLTPCSPETFQIIYGNHDPHPSCFGNLSKNLGPLGILPDEIPTTFNVFMNVLVAQDGELTIGPPTSKAGQYLELRAEMDLIVGVTACSAEMSNNYSFKPIDVEVYAEWTGSEIERAGLQPRPFLRFSHPLPPSGARVIMSATSSGEFSCHSKSP